MEITKEQMRNAAGWLGACDDAREEIEQYETGREWWERTGRGDWLYWLLYKVDVLHHAQIGFRVIPALLKRVTVCHNAEGKSASVYDLLTAAPAIAAVDWFDTVSPDGTHELVNYYQVADRLRYMTIHEHEADNIIYRANMAARMGIMFDMALPVRMTLIRSILEEYKVDLIYQQMAAVIRDTVTWEEVIAAISPAHPVWRMMNDPHIEDAYIGYEDDDDDYDHYIWEDGEDE